MRTFQTQSQAAQRGASNSTVSPLSAASVTLTALLILCIPVCRGAPAEPQQATTDQGQLLSQIDAACSSYLSADRKFRASDVLGELCVSMLVQKLKEQKVTDNSKRFTGKDLLADRLHRKYCHDKNKDCDGSKCRSLKKLQCCVLSCISFLNSTPEEREDSPCALTSRDLEESRAEVTSSIGHEMEDDPSNMSKIKIRHL